MDILMPVYGVYIVTMQRCLFAVHVITHILPTLVFSTFNAFLLLSQGSGIMFELTRVIEISF
jgi:hypothetical protein